MSLTATAGNFLFYLCAFALALGLLIVIHEAGHFLLARWCGVKVLRFSVGFGKPLLMRRVGKDGTEIALARFPLGGYVRMLDEREGEVAAEELPRAFNRQPVWKRFLIVLAGPTANFILAICLYWGLFVHGVEELKPMLGKPAAHSLAEQAGIKEGDEVRRINGKPIVTWQEFRWEMLQLALDHSQANLEITGGQGGVHFRKIDLSGVSADEPEKDALQEIGFTLFRPELAPVVGSLIPGGIADQAGIQKDDRIVAIDEQPISYWSQVVMTIRESEGKPLSVEIERAGERRVFSVTPSVTEEHGKRVGRIGIGVKEGESASHSLVVSVAYGPLAALSKAVSQTWETSLFSLKMLGRMVTGALSWKNLSGPITIADYAGQSARMGLTYYLRFLALISISLGVLNLLPIPLLDGGHLMYYTVEIFKGGPLSDRFMEIGQQIGLALLAMMMAFAFYNDINRLVSG